MTTRWRVRRLAMPTETIATIVHVNMNCLHLGNCEALAEEEQTDRAYPCSDKYKYAR